MATPVRAWYPGMIYHITTRGNRKEVIFKDTKDFKKYLEILKEALVYYESYEYVIICYCLMSNHVHLMIKCNGAEPGHFMRRVNSRYTRYFNIKYGYVGHLFQGRYYGEPITNVGQLLETSRYIHMNPVKAKIVEKVTDYKWSSIKYYKIDSTVVKTKLVEKSKQKNKYKIGSNGQNSNNIFKAVSNNDVVKICDESVGEILQYFKNNEEYMKYIDSTIE